MGTRYEDALAFILADKTNNFFKFSKDNYNKLLTDNFTRFYKKKQKKKNTAAINNFNKEAKCIAERLHLDDRVEQFKQFFLHLKIMRKMFKIIQNADYYIEKINKNITKITNMR